MLWISRNLLSSCKAFGEPLDDFAKYAASFQPCLEHSECSPRICRCTADKDVDRRQPILGPCVNRDMRFGEQRHPGDSLPGPEMMEAQIEQSDMRGGRGLAQCTVDSRNIGKIRTALEVGK